MNVSKTLLSFY